MSQNNPYSNLPKEAFWRTAIADKNVMQINNLWKPKHKLSQDYKIATAGSCFAQHIGKALAKRGYHWYDSEPAPAIMSDADKKKLNYGIFSFRTGNIYTPALLKQWVSWALGKITIDGEYWQAPEGHKSAGRWFDLMRPVIEPNGFESEEELLRSRQHTLLSIKHGLQEIDRFVFTLGLTEGWKNGDNDLVYPMCPGTLAGEFDENTHKFVNYSYSEIRRDMRETLELIKTVNPDIKFLLTVSPVPLTATASNQHVLPATIYSKSTLRAVAGDMANGRPDTDYFPSYEIVSSFPTKAMYYMPNMRSVAPEGVEIVMKNFFECQQANPLNEQTVKPQETTAPSPKKANAIPPATAEQHDDDEACEDALLDAFGK